MCKALYNFNTLKIVFIVRENMFVILINCRRHIMLENNARSLRFATRSQPTKQTENLNS